MKLVVGLLWPITIQYQTIKPTPSPLFGDWGSPGAGFSISVVNSFGDIFIGSQVENK